MEKADAILVGGKVLSPLNSGGILRAEAIAIRAGKIIAVGKEDDVKKFAGKTTKYIECKGNTILPGLCDAHCHPSISSGMSEGCDLFGIYIQEGETPEEIIDKYLSKLKVFIENHPEDELIRGTGWVAGNFTGSRVPTRHDIDRICSDKPVILESFCQHNLWVNTKAIEIAGVDEKTPDVYAGKIYREENGYPEGIFKEPEAMDLIKMRVPGYDFSIEKYKKAILYYQKNYANKYGVTLVQDCMHSDNARQAFKELAQEDKLTLRIRGVYLLEPEKAEKQIQEAKARKGIDNVGDSFRIDTVKMFAEGTFSLLEPYNKEFVEQNNLPEDYNGILYWGDDEFVATATKAMEAGFSVHVHAMGDKAVKQSVDCLLKAQELYGRESRNVIAHLMLVEDKEIMKMACAKIIGNCQPRWMVYDSDIVAMIPMMGAERAESAYPLSEFIRRGVTVTFGTDFPVTPPPDTMHEIQCAMTRRVFPDAPDYEKFKGKVLGKESPVELIETIRALSINGAYQMFLENMTGSIEVGKSADLVVLNADIENTPVDKIYNIRVNMTIFKGKVVYKEDNC